MENIYLYNTLSKKKETLSKKSGDTITMYNCGPTVYNFPHIGNLRAYILSDIIRRTYEINGFSVKQVINITDIGHLQSDGDEGEDKMTKALEREGKPFTLEAMREVAEFYAEAFKKDLKDLNIETPEYMPFASDSIDEYIDIIKKIYDSSNAYTNEDGVYFDTASIESYGKLGGLTPSEQSEERISGANKKSSADFALWKFSKNDIGYESPWGKGFPGWHIECSGMIRKFLGETIDIHTGGIDHIPVHHNNEIAQSETANHKELAHIWVHGAFVTIKDERIAKSLGNIITLEDIKKSGINPLSYRLWLMSATYQKEVSFSWEALRSADKALSRSYEVFDSLREDGEVDEKIVEKYKKEALSLINDNLDTPSFIALFWEVIRSQEIEDVTKKTLILFFDRVLGLGFSDRTGEEIPEEINELVRQRIEAREAKDYSKGDEIRDKIESLGYTIKDTENGTIVKKK